MTQTIDEFISTQSAIKLVRKIANQNGVYSDFLGAKDRPFVVLAYHPANQFQIALWSPSTRPDYRVYLGNAEIRHVWIPDVWGIEDLISILKKDFS